MTFLSFFLLSLAAWRVASLLVNERGPLDMFVWIRSLAGITHDEEGKPVQIPDNVMAGILSCVWCCSMWVALGWFLFFMISPLLAEKVAAVFSISTAAILIDRWMGN